MDRLERRAREAVAKLGKRGPRQRIPDSVREVVVEYARCCRGRGQCWAAIGEAVGLSQSTLIRWSSGRSATGRGRMMPVETVDEPVDSASGAVVLVTGEYRIEGLDVAGAAELLRRLA